MSVATTVTAAAATTTATAATHSNDAEQQPNSSPAHQEAVPEYSISTAPHGGAEERHSAASSSGSVLQPLRLEVVDLDNSRALAGPLMVLGFVEPGI